MIVHSSLSSLGWVAGGPAAVVESLSRAVGTSGTIVVPTQTGDLCDPSQWSNPAVPQSWWPIIRDEMPAFDPRTTPTRSMGRIVECFRTWPGVERSSHPTVSFAAKGPLAHQIVNNHPLVPQFGEESPLARLYELQAHVLLLGVNHGANTSLHLAEHRSNWPEKPAPIPTGSPMIIDGERQWVVYLERSADDGDFQRVADAYASEGHPQKRGLVAMAVAELTPMAALVDYATLWFTAHRRGSSLGESAPV